MYVLSGQLTVILITMYYEEINGRLKSGNACYHSVFQLPFPKIKGCGIQNYNFACCFE
jgi:hypothetical protein